MNIYRNKTDPLPIELNDKQKNAEHWTKKCGKQQKILWKCYKARNHMTHSTSHVEYQDKIARRFKWSKRARTHGHANRTGLLDLLNKTEIKAERFINDWYNCVRVFFYSFHVIFIIHPHWSHTHFNNKKCYLFLSCFRKVESRSSTNIVLAERRWFAVFNHLAVRMERASFVLPIWCLRCEDFCLQIPCNCLAVNVSTTVSMEHENQNSWKFNQNLVFLVNLPEQIK